MPLLIGLTGGIATGKSTVAKMFLDINIPVIDTDQISKELLKKGSEAYFEILDMCGQDVLLTNKDLNRKKLAKVIFEDKDKRKKLNRIVHPKVMNITLSEIKRYTILDAKIIVIDVPLLFETDFIDLVDKIITVYAKKDLQLERLIMRDKISESYALKKIESQMLLDDKVMKSDFVIDNSSSILSTKKQFNEIVKIIEVK
ncbi:MAG: dephospho-CoA kinase [Candidatus Izemoplasma sp.]